MKNCYLFHSVKFVFIIILLPLLSFANQADSSFVRLKNGARVKGEIIQKTQNSIIIKNQIMGEKEINWDDISFISSSTVYDSLQGSKSLIILPPPEKNKNFLFDNLSAEFLGGKIFSYDRFIGFGVRANIILYDLVTIGGIAILHLGSTNNYTPDGYGSLFYWGPELGLRIFTDYLIIEPSFSIGEGSYLVGNNIDSNSLYEPRQAKQSSKATAAIESDLFLAPGLSIKMNFGSMKLGFQYKYIVINNQKMSGLYISFGY